MYSRLTMLRWPRDFSYLRIVVIYNDIAGHDMNSCEGRGKYRKWIQVPAAVTCEDYLEGAGDKLN